MAVSSGFALTPADIARVLYRHKGKMALYFAGVMVAVLAMTATATREYRSESKLFVRLGRENTTIDPTATFGQGPVTALPPSREDEINSIVEMLLSRALAERVVDTMGPQVILGRPAGTTDVAAASAAPIVADAGAPDGEGPTELDIERAREAWRERRAAADEPSLSLAGLDLGGGRPALDVAGLWSWLSPFETITPRERALARFKKRFNVSAAKKSNVITVQYDTTSPELAQTVLRRVVDLYLQDYLRLTRAQGSRDFFAAQTEELRKRLADTERQLRDLKDATGVTSIDDQRRILVERIGGLEDQVLAAEAALAAANAEVRTLSAQLAELPEMLVTERASGLANEAADGMRQQLYALELREQELLSKYTDDTPVVQEIRRQIGEAKAILAGEERRRTEERAGRNPAYEQIHLSWRTAQASAVVLATKASSLRRQLDQNRRGLTTLNEHEMQLARLQRDLTLAEENYRKYSTNLEQTRIDQALESQRISNISIAQPATLEARAVRPRPLVNLAAGFAVATTGSVALAFVAEFAGRRRRRRPAHPPFA